MTGVLLIVLTLCVATAQARVPTTVFSFSSSAQPPPPAAPDADGDLLPDAWEVLHGFDPGSAGDAHLDPDGDGLANLDEWRLGGDPWAADSDGDGLADLEEKLAGTPLDTCADANGNGLPDDWETAAGEGGVIPHDDPDGDGWTLLDQFLLGCPLSGTVCPVDGDALHLDIFTPSD
jgi:hypothetical protein